LPASKHIHLRDGVRARRDLHATPECSREFNDVHVPAFARDNARNMTVQTEYFLWWVDDDGTGKPRRTTYKLTRADAARAFPGADPDVSSREIRDCSDPAAGPASSRPGRHWS